VWGVEGCQQAIDANPLKSFVTRHDFTEDVYNDAGFDLVWCCEVLEHIEETFLRNVLRSIDANVIAITAAKPGQQGYHHVNCQPEDYWRGAFAAYGYKYEAERTSEYRRLITPPQGWWFRQNGMIFTR
jgi:hypothetical protein